MKIKAGGQLVNNFGKEGHRLEQIRISKHEGTRHFELWIESTKGIDGTTAESLSYLTIDEVLDLQDEIKIALSSLIN
jgi:hypothetical protein